MSLSPEQLHVIRCYDRLPPMPGGMELHIAELTRAQRALGVRVTLIHNSGESAGESVRVLPRLRTDCLRPNHLRWFLFSLAAALRRIDRSDERVRVLHMHGDWHAFLAGRLLSRRFDVSAAAASVHGWMGGSDRSYAIALRGYAPLFATGIAQTRRLSEITGNAAIHMPSAPADLFFAPPDQRPKLFDVIAVGSLNPVKNFALLIDCAARLPQFRFALFGDGPQRTYLESLAAAKGVTNVYFGGAVSTEEIHNALCSARLFLSTSLTEGSPTAVLEAMACGLPVVMTPSNDYSELLAHGKNAWITDGWQTDQIVTAIDRLFRSPEKLNAAGEAARRVAARHRWPEKANVVTEAIIRAVK